ncbi:type III secretion HpaP family protein [Paracidovorax konjaci]|uniref:Type III secretion protein (HpaP) n=1 Tax=Paracidovorax konjaci TaxID=32040 RepID=A0A1I1VBK0_9BURK|nr:type III secretion HpaP family protein [Paracidovorax konjaci]SFD77810.1 Type III secretion protein (HpaP) [Paracidovorax konjaci]
MERTDLLSRQRMPGMPSGTFADASLAAVSAAGRFQRQLFQADDTPDGPAFLRTERTRPYGAGKNEDSENAASDAGNPSSEASHLASSFTAMPCIAQQRLLPSDAGRDGIGLDEDQAAADREADAVPPADAQAGSAVHDAAAPPPSTQPPACRDTASLSRERQGSQESEDSPADAASRVNAAPQAPPAWLQDTVQRIAWLCAQADPAFQSWSVTVPMDPAVLPECELGLSLSPYAMSLRFRTSSSESARLISLHRDPLRAQLEALGPSPRGIDIELEAST